jgi:hypothetical protein
MKNGIYRVEFTTNVGNLGVAAIVVRNQSVVGADGLQFYRGTFEQVGTRLTLVMEVTRHNFAVESAFGEQSLFTLQWEGEALNETSFKAICQPPGGQLTLYVRGRMLEATDSEYDAFA